MRVSWTEEEIENFTMSNITEFNRTFTFLSEKENLVGILEVKSMKFVTAEIVVKIKDSAKNDSTLYNTLSSKSLDKSSKLRTIIKNNQNRNDLDLSFFQFDKFKKNTPYIKFVKLFTKETPYIYVK